MSKVDESFKKAFIAWEEQAAKAWTAMLRNPDFLQQMWRAVETTMTQQRAMAQFTQQLTDINLPTRVKQSEIQDRISQMQAMVSALHEQVDKLAASGESDGG